MAVESGFTQISDDAAIEWAVDQKSDPYFKPEIWLEPLFDELVPVGSIVLVFEAQEVAREQRGGAPLQTELKQAFMLPNENNLRELYQHGFFSLAGIGLVIECPMQDAWEYRRKVRVQTLERTTYPARLPFEAFAFQAQANG